MTPCERYKESILDAVDQESPSSLKKEIHDHLDHCKACAQFHQSLVSLKKGLKKLRPVKAPDSFQVVLHERIRREMANKPGIRFEDRRHRFPTSVAYAAAVVLVLGSLYVGQTMIRESDTHDTALTVAVDDGMADRISYVIDDFDMPAQNQPQLSRIDSLLQIDRTASMSNNMQPVSF